LRISTPKLPLHRLAPCRVLRDFARLHDVKDDNASRIPQKRRQADLVSTANDQIRSIGILLARELVVARATNRYGQLLDKGVLYRILNNRVYIGDAVHKGVSYPGEHQAIIDRKLWDQVHAILKQSPRRRAACARAQTPALLKGLLFGPDGAAMSPTHTRKAGRLYRYYISQSVMKQGANACPVRQIPAAEIERIIIEQIRSLLQTPEVIIQTWRAARKTDKGITESEVRGALLEFEPIWNELFPAEQARIVELLVERVDLQPDGIDLRLRIEGLTSLCSELRTSGGSHQEAA
jgi:site-specific DNA recombinase